MAQKRILFVCLTLSLALWACSSDKKKEEERPSVKEVVDKYTDTLVTAPEKARAARDLTEKRAEAEKKAIEEATK
ncbi:MAG: hypothetical protein HY886_02295 [Deltaproteobacteria bacterium]|nr:hypothetical protein [Deltaproteobacteria bacterium]